MAVVFDMKLRSVIVITGIIQFLAFIVAEAASLTPAGRQLIDKSGFINIDCGLATGSYYHEATSSYYTSDDKYINSGKPMQVSTGDTGADGRFLTVRSFPDGNKNCYSLSPVQANHKYLISAWFMYGNYDGPNAIPGFDLYLGVDFWSTVTLQSSKIILLKEIVYFSTSDSIEVCLVNTGHGTPFISVLQLRLLDHDVYAATPDFSLRLFNRWDVGPTPDTDDPIQQCYKQCTQNDDAYDRTWYYASKTLNWKPIDTNLYIDASSTSGYKVPSGVLATAGEQINADTDFSVGYTMDNQTDRAYAYWHFAELKSLNSTDSREFNIIVSHGHNYKFGPIKPRYLKLDTIESNEIPLDASKAFQFQFEKTNQSSLLPILNAFELYAVVVRHTSPTIQQDVEAVTAIKKNYAVPRIWQGDPCLPVNYQWDGLTCGYSGSNARRITALNLTSSKLTGQLPDSLSKLTSLINLDLSNNRFTGKIPEFLAHLPDLKHIDLSGNNLTGPVPAELAKKASNKSIVLRLEGNPDVCKSFHCEKMEVEHKRRRLIIVLVASVALTVSVVIIGLILVAFRKREKKGLMDQTIKPRNKKFSHSEIFKITEGFKKFLGKGGFGSVYHGVLQDGTQVAVKVLNNSTCTLTIKQFCAEAELLTRIHHVNLVSLIGYCEEREKMALVYEYMPLGNLQMQLSETNKHPLSWKARLEICIDIAQGMDYLHSGCQPLIIHRDVKPANILLDDMGHAKISDFGLSRYFTTHSQAIAMTDVAGTMGYLDPEYIQTYKLSLKNDVYSFGIVLLGLITGKPPFIRQKDQIDDHIHIVEWVKQVAEREDILTLVDKRLQGEFNHSSAWRLQEIAMECVKPSGAERPRMSEVLAELKLCYASDHNNPTDVAYEIDCCIDSSKVLDRSCDSLLP